MICAHCDYSVATRRILIGKAFYPLCSDCAVKLDAKGRITNNVKELARLYDRRRRVQKLVSR